MYRAIGILSLIGLACLAGVDSAHAQRAPYESALTPDLGKLPLTAGFTDIDGAGGGGLVPWATITGYGTDQSWGANVHYTAVPLNDFRLQSYGAAVGILDRLEASITEDRFDATAGTLNDLGVRQQIAGLKIRLSGDAVYAQDSWAPQTALGLEYKRKLGISGVAGVTDPRQLAADHDSGLDLYVSATKVLLAESMLLDLTLRYTKENQFGLLGFGGDLNHGRSVEPEATIAYLVSRTVALGAEYRAAPRNLSIDDERAAWDAFAAWTISRHLSVVAGYANLGSILSTVSRQFTAQGGAYVSVQAGF